MPVGGCPLSLAAMLIKHNTKQSIQSWNTQHRRTSHIFTSHAIIVIFIVLCVTCITDVTAEERAAHAPIEATLPAIGSVLHWIAPEINVHCLLPEGAEPHHFHPSARQLERANNSVLLVRSSRDDLAWFKAQRVQSTHVLDLWQYDKKGNNHAWLLPSDIENIVPIITRALVRQFPQYQHSIEARKSNLEKDIDAVQQAWETLAVSLRKRGVMMQHAAWLPLFKAYHIPVLSVLEASSAGHQHGYNAKKLDQALKQLQQHPDALLIADKRHDDKGLKWLQRQHPSSPLIYLDAIGQCNQPWPLLMQQNIDRLASAVTAK